MEPLPPADETSTAGETSTLGEPPTPGEPNRSRPLTRLRRSPWRDYLEALLIAVVFATFARSFVLQAFKIPSASMEDNLLVGDHILVNKFVYGPTGGDWLLPIRSVRRGDIVVFRYPQDPSRDFIKRCIGIPGDVVEIRAKKVLVNGEEVGEAGYVVHRDERTYPRSIFLSEEYRNRDYFGPFTVPEGELFFLGDNRDDSNDSRFWGTVPQKYVKGRALLVYWSFDASENASGWKGLGHRLGELGEVAINFPSRTRWNRSLKLIR